MAEGVLTLKVRALHKGIRPGDNVDLLLVDSEARKAQTVANKLRVFSIKNESPNGECQVSLVVPDFDQLGFAWSKRMSIAMWMVRSRIPDGLRGEN